MHKFNIVFMRNYLLHLKSKSFIALLVTPIISVLISAGIGGLVASSTSNFDNYQVAVVGDSSVKSELVSKDKDSIDTSIKSESTAKKELKKDNIDGYIKVSKENNQYKINFVGSSSLDSDVKTDLLAIVNQKQAAINVKTSNVTSEQYKQLSVKPAFKSSVTDKEKKQKSDQTSNANTASIYVLIFISYFFTLIYASIMSTTIAKEKGTKISEVIFSSVSPSTYFSGKVGAVIALMATQMVIYSSVGVIAYFILNMYPFFNSLFSSQHVLISTFIGNIFSINLLFILVGFVIAIVLAAICGSLSANVEGASKSAQPLVFLILFIFVLSFNFVNDGASDSIFSQVGSYIPLFSSFLMPIRLINHAANFFEGIISLLIAIAFIAFVTYKFSNVYKLFMLNSEEGSFFKRIKSALNNK
ncbi:ABC transporter permease [Apilactobacillus kunkeei]|uniref:ABC transporter permease n=1 Tax=Apilactobacillus kunkeei TaxID=148814 RepID=UPI0024C618CD|nr:ABC transporter permease [Apilactobacillus kunkeei]UZX33164.1 ABC transporter permease [Apilactobacillus kunkeei]